MSIRQVRALQHPIEQPQKVLLYSPFKASAAAIAAATDAALSDAPLQFLDKASFLGRHRLACLCDK